ncbi:MAG: ATP cone domain-containing protein [Oligoflexales bacterium]
MLSLSEIKKRNGLLVPFDPTKIEIAVQKAMEASDEGSPAEAKIVAEGVIKDIMQIKARFKEFVPDVEGIQDLVEKALILDQYAKTAKSYIIYRIQHAQSREQLKIIPEKVKKLSKESHKYFHNKFNEFVYLRTYARWIEAEDRRETWIETVDRYMDFMQENLDDKLKKQDLNDIREMILSQGVMPSMRLMQFSGSAARSTHVCAYNCSYIAPSELDDFAEVMYILMCGTGVGFSVENQNVQALPQIAFQNGTKPEVFKVPDSREGWADAVKIGMHSWYSGRDIEFDCSACRPSGARLKTFGGRSSGPEPLRSLLEFIKERVLRRQGSRLNNIDVHDIICKMGECVVAGGVRRSALISLSELDDPTMRDAKSGPFYLNESQRSIANNSAVYNKKPSNREFLDEWISLIKSGSGERGIFNRGGLMNTLPERRKKALRIFGDITDEHITGLIGTNPCGEIVLRSKQFCNLTEVIARPDDTVDSLRKKIRIATLLGTYQSSLTNFPYLSEKWKENCETERLLGVSITGQWDCPALRDGKVLETLKDEAINANLTYAKSFGIQPSTAITCVKPSGNVSQVVDCASGMHPRFAPYYIRRVRIAATDALFKMCKAQGVPYKPEVGQDHNSATTYVLEFPVKSPNNSIYANSLSAIEQLDYWKIVKTRFTEHNPSVTIYVQDDEWIEVANWIYDHWEIVGGLTFLPKSNHIYQLAPYEEISKEKYEELVTVFKKVDFSSIVLFEKNDETELKRELACTGNSCEL